MRKQNIIQSTLTDLAEDVNEIKRKIAKNNSSLAEDAQSVFTVLNLPIESNEDLEKLEEYLRSDITAANTVSI